MPMIIEKRPGLDWIIYYIDTEDDARYAMTVFGSPTIEDALQEAERSFSAWSGKVDVTIVGIVRQDVNVSAWCK